MFIGNENEDYQFSMIDKYNGIPYLSGFDKNCKVNLTNATEFLMLHPSVEKSEVIYFIRKEICRAFPVYYEGIIQGEPP